MGIGLSTRVFFGSRHTISAKTGLDLKVSLSGKPVHEAIQSLQGYQVPSVSLIAESSTCAHEISKDSSFS